jgi:hypothetical protein
MKLLPCFLLIGLSANAVTFILDNRSIEATARSETGFTIGLTSAVSQVSKAVPFQPLDGNIEAIAQLPVPGPFPMTETAHSWSSQQSEMNSRGLALGGGVYAIAGGGLQGWDYYSIATAQSAADVMFFSASRCTFTFTV